MLQPEKKSNHLLWLFGSREVTAASNVIHLRWVVGGNRSACHRIEFWCEMITAYLNQTEMNVSEYHCESFPVQNSPTKQHLYSKKFHS